ncbi:hypothetical protein ACFL46_02890 [Candidatus Neomarinimicrobiota bacterium]
MSFKTTLTIIVFTLATLGCTDFINPLSSESSSGTSESEFIGTPAASGGSENGSVVTDDNSGGTKNVFIGGPNRSGGSENG